MSNTTLLKSVKTGQLDTNGGVTIINRPEVGEYWAPLLVAVSSFSPNTPVPYAAVYHGSPGVAPQNSQFIDDTYQGSGDVSSVISGSSVQFGEAVITVFSGGTPGDTVTVTVYGQNSDTPSNLSLVPQVPGVRFSGHLTTETVQQNGFVATSAPTVILAAAQRTLNSQTPNGFTDVRQFSSYNVKILASTVAAATAVNVCRVLLTWSSDAAGTDVLYQDFAEWFPNSTGGVFPVANGFLFLQDVHHGPYFNVTFTNGAAADSVNLSYSVQYTTRLATSQRYMQQRAGLVTAPDGILALTGTVAIAAGVTVNFMLPFAYGRGSWRLENNGAGAGLIYNIYYGLALVRQFVLAAGGTDEREFILPKHAMRVEIVATNNTTYKFNAITQYDKMG